MKKIFIFLGLLLAAEAQVAIVPFLSIGGVTPNLVLVLILFLVAREGFNDNWGWIVLVSVFLDCLSGHLFGLVSLSLVLTACLVDLLNTKIFSAAKFWMAVFSVAVGTVFYDAILVALARFFQVNLIFNYRSLPAEIAYQTVLLIIIFYGFKKVFHQK